MKERAFQGWIVLVRFLRIDVASLRTAAAVLGMKGAE